MLSRTVEVAVDARAQLGEGPRWDAAAQRLLWVDIHAGHVHVGERRYELGARVGAVAPVDAHTLLVALADRLARLDLRDGTLTDEVRFPHGPDVRANDGLCDERGRFWIGTMAVDEGPGRGALYRWDGVDLARILDADMSNGLGWSPDGTRMYYVDSLTGRVDVFDYDGDVTDRRALVEIDAADGIPDGLAVDDEGGVWVALWGGSCVRRYDERGRLDGVLEVPAKNPTACCFAGTSLYVTSAAPDGRVFVADVGVAGPPAQPFRSTAPSAAGPTSAR